MTKSDTFEFLPQHDFENDAYYGQLTSDMDEEAITYYEAVAYCGGDFRGAYRFLNPHEVQRKISNRASEMKHTYMERPNAKPLVAYLIALMGVYEEHKPITLEEIVRQAERDYRSPTTDAKTRVLLGEKIAKWRGLNEDTLDKTTDLQDEEIHAALMIIAREGNGATVN